VFPHTIIPLGCRAVTVALTDTDTATARDQVRCFAEHVRALGLHGVTGIVPAITSVTLHYEPRLLTVGALADWITDAMRALVITPDVPRVPIILAVCYGGEFGPDLADVALAHETTPDAIIEQHTAAEYTVAMLGFLPGFPYLEGLPSTLHTPRRKTPRTTVPAGSVAIGGGSTGVYPFASPGGWHLIGRTPRALFVPRNEPPALLAPGDRVRFEPITAAQFRHLAARA
jgi:inhibitor of KinA